MTYVCPICGQDSLTIIARMVLATEDCRTGPSGQLLLCGHCGLHAVGIDGRTAEENPSSHGYIVDKGVWTELHLSWAGCPDPSGLPLSGLTHRNLDLLSNDDLRAFTMVPAVATS